MRYPTVTAVEARKFILARRESPRSAQEPPVVKRGTGEELDLSFIEQLRAEFVELVGNGPESFETTGPASVHRLVTAEPEVIADPEFWIWMATIHFSDTIEWRYGNKPGGCDLKNYGIGASGENLIYRLWLRGEIGHDRRRADPYEMSRRGDVDFWRSHVFRQGYASYRTFAQALVRFQYSDKSPDRARLKIAEIRELVKRLRRLRENLIVEYLDEEACSRLIRSEANRIET